MKNKKLLGILGITALLLAGNFAWQNAKEVDAATPATLYLSPGAWSSDGARYAAYFFGNGEKWVSFADNNKDGFYEVTVPSGFSKVILCRMNGSNSTNNWNNKWNQTEDLTIPSDGNNCWTFSTWNGGADGKSTGTWSTYSVPTYNLAGDMSGWATDNTNYELLDGNNDGTYELDVLLAKGTYEFKIAENGKWDVNFGGNHTFNDAATKQLARNNDNNAKLVASGGHYKFSYVLSTNNLTITHTNYQSINELFGLYYNSGSYTKETVLNVNTAAMTEIKDYFHAGAQAKYRQTIYSSGQLVMKSSQTEVADWNSITNTSTYKDNNNNGVDHLKNGVKDYSVSGQVGEENRSSVENWFVTLNDFKDSSITGWTYASGVYTFDLSKSANMEKMAREFVAPMWLATDKAKNYVTFTSLTVQETADGLVMKLYATGDTGKIDDANGVFAQATITK